MKAAICTLGCKVNQYESQVMSEALESHGYEIVSPDKKADVYVVNSCTVTAESDRKTRQLIRKLKRKNPLSAVVLTGCVPQAYPEIENVLPQADILLGNNNNSCLISALNEYFSQKNRLVLIKEHRPDDVFPSSAISTFRDRTRANIKIEDGCNRFCSYCIIPYARGRVRSKPIAELEAEVKALADDEFTEIVLVGINLSAYNSCGATISDAVKAASAPDSIKRVRLGSLEPDHLTDKIIDELASCEKLCPHFHISLQSGCNLTLKRMNRHYTAEEYELLCNKLRSRFADAALTTDVMVGFAGETDEDFEQSRLFVEKIGFEKVHVFPYSIRQGTRAASFDGQIEKAVKEIRAHEMLETAAKIRSRYLSEQIGKTVEVISESNLPNGLHEGFTRNYTPVHFSGLCRPGSIVTVIIKGATADFCTGTIVY